MEKPIIRPTVDTAAFWEGCRDRVVRYQACIDCGTVQLIPRGVCTHCHGRELEWKDSAGQGAILSHTTVHRAPTPAFKADVPYVIALVDMDEGFRLMVNVREGAGGPVFIGQRVRIGFEARGDGMIPVAQTEAA